MLEISLKHDDTEIQLLRVSDSIDTDAVVNLIRAALDTHKATLDGLVKPNEPINRSSSSRSKKSADGIPKEPTMTTNAQAVLLALHRFGEPLGEARTLMDSVKQDTRWRGESIETVRHYLREFEKAGWLQKTTDGRKELTPKGLEAAFRFANPIATEDKVSPDQGTEDGEPLF